VAGGPERAAHLAEAVRAAPCPVNQDEDRHQHQPFRHRRQRGGVIFRQPRIQTCLLSVSTEMPDTLYKADLVCKSAG
jgi:hypothetical protein